MSDRPAGFDHAAFDAEFPGTSATAAACLVALVAEQRRQLVTLLTTLREHMPTLDVGAVVRAAPARRRPGDDEAQRPPGARPARPPIRPPVRRPRREDHQARG